MEKKDKRKIIHDKCLKGFAVSGFRDFVTKQYVKNPTVSLTSTPL